MKNDQKLPHEEQAKKLQDHLADASRHEESLRPFEQTADALKREASATDAKLDSGVVRIQRHMLMELAKKHKEAQAPAPAGAEAPKSKSVVRHASPWLAWLGGAATVIAVFFAAVFVQNIGPKNGNNLPSGSKNVAAVARLVIPEASAADAFTLITENQDASGADPSTSFLVKSAIPLTSEEMRNHVRIVPAATSDAAPVAVTVDLVSDGQFRVRPVESLTPGVVYKVGLDAAVKKADGELQARDFTWAIQTKNVFRALSSVPAPDATYVPINAGIEFVMSMPNWEDPKSHFSITPAVDGRFEAHGRSLVFVPTKPLKPGQLYIATLKKGLKVKGSDRQLEQDIVLRFETATGNGMPNVTWSVSLQQPFLTSAPQKDILVPFWADTNVAMPEITVTGYALSLDETKRLIEEEAKVPGFAEATRLRGEAFKNAAKNQAFQVIATVEKQNYQDYLHIAPLPEGRYVVKVEPKGYQASWFFLQVTKVATYVISDKDSTVVWAMNSETGRPLEGMSVIGSSNSAKTDASGIARMPTPAQLNSTSTDGVAVLTVGEGSMSSVIRLVGGTWNIWNRWAPTTDDKNVSYVMADRPMYHPTDTLHAFGKVLERDTNRPAGNLTLELQRSGFFDWFSTGKEKIYRSTGLQSDAQGVFRGELSWNNLAPGYYQLVLKSDGVLVRSRSIEVRDFVKPAYRLEVTTDRRAVFSGETAKAQVRATFYDGTPVPNLDLTSEVYGPGSLKNNQLTTNADGLATFEVPTQMAPCGDDSVRSYCDSSTFLNLTLRPVDAENAEIMGATSLTVWRARVDLESTSQVKGDTATVTVTARGIDLTKAETSPESMDVLSDPKRNQTIYGRIYEVTWDRRESGTYYDFIEKKVVPNYTYTQNFREIAPINVITDAQGKASIKVPAMRANASYRAAFITKDERGVEQREVATFSREGYFGGYPGNSSDISFEAIAADRTKPGYDLGDTATYEVVRNGARLADSAAPNFLFIKAQRGIKEVRPSTEAVYRFTFNDNDVPNVGLRAVVFLNGGFIERQSMATFNSLSRELKITVTSDATSYAPGGKATVHIKAVDKQGKAASNARLGLSVIDEALFDAANSSGEEAPLNDLYTSVSDGILLTQESHAADAAQLNRIGGAEMGGGGGMGDGVRRSFKDTADFQVVQLDGNGEADMTVKLPDNLTSWRTTAVALGNDLTAGYGRGKLIVTKPVFVEAVAPMVLLSTDKPVLKLRAYGMGLTAGTKVTYNIDAPTLGLKQDFDGVVGTPTYIAIDKLTDGEHAMVLRVTSPKGSDALEKKVRIVASRFLRQEAIQADLAPGSTLPDIGQSREVDLTILPKTRAQYLNNTESLSQVWSQRVESRIAANIARALMQDQFAAKNVAPQESLSRYQKPSGGIAILPYASEDIELSSKIASIAPDQFDRVSLSKYFYDTLKKTGLTREQQIRAVSGLAALGEPMLPELRAFGEQKNLTWREQLALANGAVAAGDQDLAKAMLAPFFARMEEHDGQSFIRVSEDKRDQIEATAEMAVVAARLNIPEASRLNAWLQNNWALDAFSDLDRIAYLQVVVPAAIGRDVSLSYTIGNGEKQIVLKDGVSESLTLTAEEAKAFRTVSVDGPAVAVFTREVPSTPTQNKDLSLTRTITTKDGKPVTSLKEGEGVTVTLEPKFSSSAPSGCYLLRDHAPAGLSPMVSLSFTLARDIGTWYPQNVDGNTVSFTVCNAQDGKTPTPIKYNLRVVARGTYTAEPAILQSDTTPSVSVTTPPQTVEIK